MKNKAELLFEEVFDSYEVNELANEDNENSGKGSWDCGLLWYACLHGMTIGYCGGGIDTSACEAMRKYC